MSDSLINLIDCPRCARKGVEQDPRSPHLCVDCVKAENSRVSYYRQHQGDWMTVAKESGLQVWEQQPGETQWEFTVWTAYRDSYPGKKPSYADVARQLDTTYESVKKIAGRWTFQMRMQAWMRFCDEITLAQRTAEILEMNKEHVDMAKELRGKLNTAIKNISTTEIKPGEIATLMRAMADLERQARIDTVNQEETLRMLMRGDENPALKKNVAKSSDLTDVVRVLVDAGVLGDITQVGVRSTKTETTEMLLTNDAGDVILAKVEE